ncbi:hypothetical protein ACN24L_36875 [Streptomyces microflavus]
MTVQAYARRCEELFALGGYAQVRVAAGQGLAETGPGPVLQRWLGLAHAAEDDDDHDAEAEAVYEEGLRNWPDDLGLLVSYLELCLRADSWEYPGRQRRAQALKERIAELAPPGTPQAAQVEAALGWAGRSYWEDAWAKADRARAEHASLRAAEVAATLEVLSSRRHAPLRVVHRYRVVSYVAAFVLSFATNKVLVGSGAVSFSLWGWLWYLPLLLAELKLREARQLARDRVLAAVEARHASTS